MTRFASAAEGLEREAKGLVRVTCPSDVAVVVVAPLLPVLLARHPGLRVELAAGAGVGLVPRPSAAHHGLVPVALGRKLRDAVFPSDELFLVTHRALRDVPRVRVLWDLLLERVR